MPSKRAGAPEGFSLVELMVAMVVTMIVVGAVYGLLSGGQSAFRVQPERTERQQNIRSAMDLIMRDIGAAGDGMPPFVQTFRPGLNASCGGCADGPPPMGPNNELTDELEIISNPAGLPNETACNYNGGNSTNIVLKRRTTLAQTNMAVMIIMTNGAWTIRNLNKSVQILPGAPGVECDNGVDHAWLEFNIGTDPTGFNVDGALCHPVSVAQPCAWGNACASANPDGTCDVKEISMAQVIRYRLRLSGAVPELQRSVNAGAFQAVARGIEDLQVQYVQANSGCTLAAPCDNAPTVTQTAAYPPGAAADFNALITQVRVTLSARSSLRGIQGETTSATGSMRTALRGQLVSTGTPRAALFGLNKQPGAVTAAVPVWR